MRPWLIAMLLLSAVLAGCADDPTETTDDSGDGNVDGGDDGTGGNATGGDGTGADGTGGPAANNTAPVANLTADLLNGTAPLAVNFTLDGSDADGDNLTWTLAINGNQTANGTTLPTAFNFTFEVGNHTVLLTVSDGNLSSMANVTITVAQGIPAGPCGAEPAPCIIEEHPWVTVWSDGRCDAKGARGHGAAGWIHDRPGGTIQGQANPAGGDWPTGTGYISGGGTWIYEETNGIDGLQLNDNVAASNADFGTDGFAVDKGCTGGDTMVF